MAIKLSNGKFRCMFCNFTDNSAIIVDAHRDKEHDFVLVPLLREDIVRLQQFIMTKDEKLITERLWNTIRTYAKFRMKQFEHGEIEDG